MMQKMQRFFIKATLPSHLLHNDITLSQLFPLKVTDTLCFLIAIVLGFSETELEVHKNTFN